MITSPPPAGLLGLTYISGEVGRLAELGQYLNGQGFAPWEHAFVTLPNGLIIEAEPGGARIVPLHYNTVYWCNNIFRLLPPGTSATEIAHVGESLKGVKYSAMDYFALAAHRLRLPVPGLRHYIADSGHMICSQLADEFYQRLGSHIFANRWSGYVTPMSLYNRDIELGRPPGGSYR